MENSKLALELYDAAFKYLGTKIDGSPVVPRDFANRLLPRLRTKLPKDKLVSEFLYYYVAPKGAHVMSVPVKGQQNLHYFIEWPNETLVDLLLEQYDFSTLDFAKSKKVKVVKAPSQEVKELAELLGFTDDDLDME